ncbi:3-phosphoshikimate 1-carboxyvinyltransferase [Eubacteriales bacterium OttesenSCG-928-G02]|nr:3-phosphoshikimate 1-carboxyvinyltransferase [Eubacteriales bacterium OttesenSCG-928-G02]
MKIKVKPSFLQGEINAVSSKSDVHRMLFCAAGADRETTIISNVLSDDIKATISVISSLGANVITEKKNNEYYISVTPIKTVAEKPKLHCFESGSTARFAIPYAAALYDEFTVTGSEGLEKRPFLDICLCLSKRGCNISSYTLPITVKKMLVCGDYFIDGDISSQYISGLLLALPLLNGESRIILTSPLKSSGYVDMTIKTLKQFGVPVYKNGNEYIIKNFKYKSPGVIRAEGDWSNSGFWLAAGAINGDITVKGLNINSCQKDRLILDFLEDMGADITKNENSICVKKSALHGIDIDAENIPDMVMSFVPAAVYSSDKTTINNTNRLRIKESDRVNSIKEVLKNIGGKCIVYKNKIVIHQSEIIGGQVDSFNDHRVAMMAAVLAIAGSDSVSIKKAEAVNKTYPHFFEDFVKLGGNIDVI